MFKVPIWGDIDGKTIKVFLGRRYKIATNSNIYEGTITKCENESFLISTVKGGFAVSFELINNIEEI